MSDELAQPKKKDGRANNGGARKDAGRKKKAEKYEGKINAAERVAANALKQRIENLIKLGDGGYERATERWEAAGTITVKQIVRGEDGKPLLDKQLKVQVVELPAFPDKKPDELVLVERQVEITDMDRAANQWIAEWIGGKPTVHVESEGQVEHKLPPALEEMIAKVYGDDTE